MAILVRNIKKLYNDWRTFAWLKIRKNGAWHDFLEHGRFFYKGDWYEIGKRTETAIEDYNWHITNHIGSYDLYSTSIANYYEVNDFSGFLDANNNYQRPDEGTVMDNDNIRGIVTFDTSKLSHNSIAEIQKVEIQYRWYAAQYESGTDYMRGNFEIWRYTGNFPLASEGDFSAYADKMYERYENSHEDDIGDGGGIREWIDVTNYFRETVKQQGLASFMIRITNTSDPHSNAMDWGIYKLRITYEYFKY